MPDWDEFVRERLTGISLEPRERSEVAAELADHLEETFEQLRRQGLPEEAAVERALSQVKNWQSLRRRIQVARSKENIMTNRVRQWWLPGFVALFLSVTLLMVNEFIGIRFGITPLIVSAHPSEMSAPVAVIYVPWLLSLPPIGAIGAYLASRAGAPDGRAGAGTVPGHGAPVRRCAPVPAGAALGRDQERDREQLRRVHARPA